LKIHESRCENAINPKTAPNKTGRSIEKSSFVTASTTIETKSDNAKTTEKKESAPKKKKSGGGGGC